MLELILELGELSNYPFALLLSLDLFGSVSCTVNIVDSLSLHKVRGMQESRVGGATHNNYGPTIFGGGVRKGRFVARLVRCCLRHQFESIKGSFQKTHGLSGRTPFRSWIAEFDPQ